MKMGVDFDVNVHVKTDGKEKIDQLERQLESLNSKAVKIKINADGDTGNIKSILNSLSKQKIKINADTSNLAKTKSDFQMIKNIANELSQKKIKLAGLDTDKNANQVKELSLQVNKLESDFTSLYNVMGKSLNVNEIGQLNQILGKANDKIDETKAKAEDMTNAIKTSTKTFSGLDTIIASNKTLTWLKNNSAAAKDYGEQLRNLAEAQRNASSYDELKNLNKQFKSITSEASRLGVTGKSAGDEFKRAFMQIGQFSQIYGGIDKFIGTVSNAVTELKEMDDILTEISKVSEMSGSQLRQLGEDAFGYANKYGKTVTDYLEGVTEMNRSGYYGQQGIDLANTSVLAQAAGDMTANVANAYLLATNASYEYAGSAEKLNAVLDGQNMITNRNSVDMTDMAEATTQAGSMAAQAGVEVDQLSALIGTAVSRTKKSGNEIGTALKALFINLQNTQNSKIVGTFDNLGISMTKMVGDSELLKTPIELIKELSDAYNTLPDGSVMKADILTNIGGKHHANVLSSILSGYGDYEKMLKDYSEGSGSAAVEAEKSANNWSGSLNKLSNSWTEFIGNFVKSDQVIAGIKGVNGLVDAMDSLVTTLGPIGTIGAGAGIFSFFKNLDEPKNHRVSA